MNTTIILEEKHQDESNKSEIEKLLREGKYKELFIDELGWSDYEYIKGLQIGNEHIEVKAIGRTGSLAVVFSDLSSCKNSELTRKKVIKEISKTFHENLLITEESGNDIFISWRNRNKKIKTTKTNKDAIDNKFINKLRLIEIKFSDYDMYGNISTIDVIRKVDSVLDLELITKSFYDKFKKAKDKFLKSIENINDIDDLNWYSSVILNRLMFCKFIQNKGLLDNNENYLEDKLLSCSKDEYSYYDKFLKKLFFEGIGKPKSNRSKDVENIIGEIPYLNGGLFTEHKIEKKYKDIKIHSSGFNLVFKFFNEYEWGLNTNVSNGVDEISPDILGYIFEKYINQKENAAYYTKDDITNYISENSIALHIYKKYKSKSLNKFIRQTLNNNLAMFVSNDLLKYIDIAEYKNNKIYKQNINETLNIELEFKLKNELINKLQKELDKDFNFDNLLNYNIDFMGLIYKYIDDVNDYNEIWRLFSIIREIKVIDPTCGSGAFLFSAMNILEILYEKCIKKIVSIINIEDDQDYDEFLELNDEIKKHPNVRYYIYKNIIMNNIYGLDIMGEAIEICKLRLFLKLISQIDDKKNIEPLPDIDFNIIEGNALVGFLNLDKYMSAFQEKNSQLTFFCNQEIQDSISSKLEHIDTLNKEFINYNRINNYSKVKEVKIELSKQINDLDDEVNEILYYECGINKEIENWKVSVNPLNWFIKFNEIINQGGFDIVIGNPPYLESKDVNYTPKGFSTPTIHSMCIERAFDISNKNGIVSMILPMSIVCTQRMKGTQAIVNHNSKVWYSNFSFRPAKLFDNVNRALSIFIASKNEEEKIYSTKYIKWYAKERNNLMRQFFYTEVKKLAIDYSIPKINYDLEYDILDKMTSVEYRLENFVGKTQYNIYYRSTGGLYWKIFTNFQPLYKKDGVIGNSSREKKISMIKEEYIYPTIAVLSSDIFWWWYTVNSSMRDLNPIDLYTFPIPKSIYDDDLIKKLGEEYIEDIIRNSNMAKRKNTESQTFYVRKSRKIIEKINKSLAKHYNLKEDEINFISQYDIEYRIKDED